MIERIRPEGNPRHRATRWGSHDVPREEPAERKTQGVAPPMYLNHLGYADGGDVCIFPDRIGGGKTHTDHQRSPETMRSPRAGQDGVRGAATVIMKTDNTTRLTVNKIAPLTSRSGEKVIPAAIKAGPEITP